MITQASAPEKSSAPQLSAIQAYAERRRRLWKQIKAGAPNLTDEEIEARLEQIESAFWGRKAAPTVPPPTSSPNKARRLK
jgi:hypothetical protein